MPDVLGVRVSRRKFIVSALSPPLFVGVSFFRSFVLGYPLSPIRMAGGLGRFPVERVRREICPVRVRARPVNPRWTTVFAVCWEVRCRDGFVTVS